MSDAEPVERPRAIVAGHAQFAHGLVSAVQQITGRGAVFHPVSVVDLSGPDIEALLRDTMLRMDIRVIFTDLQAGSCTMAARRLLRGMDDAVLICGVNLPTLLDFVFATGVPDSQAAQHALERGRAAMNVTTSSGSAPGT
ncbi:MAG: system fructose subfamily component [Gemmatimonadetes bacterium]|nr:system fructose subfamily component [Gemmatimonadota bacterium]